MAVFNNHVLIDPDEDHFSSGAFQFYPNSFDDYYRVAVTGRIVDIPERLTYSGYYLAALKRRKERLPEIKRNALLGKSMPWDTGLEVCVGDKVFFRHLYQHGEDNVVFINGKRHLLIPYSGIVAVRENSGLRPVNGRLILKTVDEVRSFQKPEISLQMGVVVYEGRDNLHYLSGHQSKVGHIGKGRLVLYRKHNVRLLENPDFKTLEDTFLYIQKRDVIAILHGKTSGSKASVKGVLV